MLKLGFVFLTGFLCGASVLYVFGVRIDKETLFSKPATASSKAIKTSSPTLSTPSPTPDRRAPVSPAPTRTSKAVPSIQEYDGIRFVLIEGGEFEFGSPDDELGRDRALETRKTLRVEGSFSLSSCEITEGTYWREIDPSRSVPPMRRKKPITGITWNEAREFCQRLSERHARTFRLPTEVEWEFACRAGTRGMYSHWKGGEAELTKAVQEWRDKDRGWLRRGAQRTFNFNSGGPESVASFESNANKLFDMHGNVWEWCQVAEADGLGGAPSLKHRPIRGGAYSSTSLFDCRSAKRAFQRGDKPTPSIGFRVLLEN